MKLKISHEYFRRLKKVLVKLEWWEFSSGVNTWAVFLLTYSAAFISLKKVWVEGWMVEDAEWFVKVELEPEVVKI